MGGKHISGTPNRVTLHSIQYLRGIAALMIVAHHTLAGIYGGTPFPPLHGGVDLFFVISGMILWVITVGRPGVPSAFFRRRMLRIIPVYWAVTTVMVVVLLAAPSILHTAHFDLAHIIASYLFVPWPHPPPYTGAYPLLVPAWTLTYEVFLYIVFSVALASPNTRVRAGVILGALVSLVVVAEVWPDLPFFLQVYSQPLVLDFALGVVIAITVRHIRAPRTGLLLIVFGCALMVLLARGEPTGMDRLIRLGIPSGLIVAGAVMWERGRRVPMFPAAELVGDSSFAICMSHTPLLAALMAIWNRSSLAGTHVPSFVILCVIASMALGIVLHLQFERPVAAVLRPKRVAA